METTLERMPNWPVGEARARFSALLDRVAFEGPQRISRNGAVAAILIRPQDWRRPDTGGVETLLALGQDVGLSDEEVDALFPIDLSPAEIPVLEWDEPGGA